MPRPTAAAIATIIIGAVAVFLLVGRAEPDAPDPAPDSDAPTTLAPPNAVVERVIDGDTVDVILDDGGIVERVRLIGIDTPETKIPDRPVECYGPQATAFVESLLPVGTPVLIERDVVGRDDFGRLLGYVRRADDGLFVNLELVRQGYARPLTIAPNTSFAEVFVAAATDAEAEDTGLWAACG